MKISDTGYATLQARQPVPGSTSGAPGLFSTLLASELEDAGQAAGARPMLLGTITRDTPTVSQLLYKTPLKSKCWQIINDKINSDKAFNRIRPGTQIHYDPETRELLWGKDLDTAMARAKSADPVPQKAVAAKMDLSKEAGTGTGMDTVSPKPSLPGLDLSETAKQFIGLDYDQMDCYELLVGGLEELGVRYAGKGGLHEHLVRQASQQGFARNHYLNGEGLVSASGTDVYKKTYYRITDPAGTVEDIMADLAPKLAQGQILSFSMKNRGHTGVVSRKDGQWTFINSGRMDNNLSGANGKKAVGEESLKAELLNWFKLVNREKQALQITLGSLSMDRLSAFQPPGQTSGLIRQKA